MLLHKGANEPELLRSAYIVTIFVTFTQYGR